MLSQLPLAHYSDIYVYQNTNKTQSVRMFLQLLLSGHSKYMSERYWNFICQNALKKFPSLAYYTDIYVCQNTIKSLSVRML